MNTLKLRHIAGILGSIVPAPAPELTFEDILSMQEQLEAANQRTKVYDASVQVGPLRLDVEPKKPKCPECGEEKH